MSRIHRLIVPGAVAGILGIVAGILWTIPWLMIGGTVVYLTCFMQRRQIKDGYPSMGAVAMARKRHPWRGTGIVVAVFATLVATILALARVCNGH